MTTYYNYWIDNHTVEGCIKWLRHWLDVVTRGMVFADQNGFTDLITQFYDDNPQFFDYIDNLYVEFVENKDDSGRYWYSNIDVKEYEDD